MWPAGAGDWTPRALRNEGANTEDKYMVRTASAAAGQTRITVKGGLRLRVTRLAVYEDRHKFEESLIW